MSEPACILVAEDEEEIRNNIAKLLRLEGFEVVEAADGREGLALARERLPALILSDAMMPNLDGHGFLVALRADPLTATIPFVFLTARADKENFREGMNLGADDYLAKPFRRDELMQAVRTRLTRRAAQTEVVAELRQEAKRLFHFDVLTGLPNRTLFNERLQAATGHAQRHQFRLALLVLGLDGFGRINDSLGHETGDRVLRLVADRLLVHVSRVALINENGGVARLSGDQFAVLLADFGNDAYLDSFSRDLLAALAEPYRFDNHEMFLTACAGATVFDPSREDSASLLQNAEVAFHSAKNTGPGSLHFFAPEMNQYAVRRLRVHNELHNALERNELALRYQPQVAIAAGRIIGFEALMRWEHPELGSISPVEFIPIAEESGLIVPMGEWALLEACRQTKIWLDAGLGPLRVAVNLSARQFAEEGLDTMVAKALTESELPPAALELEITESIAMQAAERVIATLTALKRLGIALAMDDFGTGYSSLAYLKRLPLDVLKVDQSFVRNITSDPGDAAITRAVVAMAHSFGLSVIAEGVETEAQLNFLRELGCEEYQGNFFSKPLPATEIGALLAARRK